MPQLPEPVPPEVTQLAEQHQLGLLIDGFVTNRKQGVWKQKDVGNRVYAYEPGLIRIYEGQPIEALRWEWFNRVEQSIVAHHTNSAYNATRFTYTLYRPDGNWSRFSGSYRDPAKARVDPYDNDVRYAMFLRDGTASIWQRYMRASLTALSRGETLTFGEVSIDANGMHTRKGTLRWDEVSKLSYVDGHISIEKHGKLLPFVVVPIAKLSDHSHLINLAEHLRRQ